MRHRLAKFQDKIAVKNDEIDWTDPKQREWLKWLCEQRSPEGLSALARHVLKFDTWTIQRRGEARVHRSGTWKWRNGIWRTCGIVDWGPHREMLETLLHDGDKVLLCTRDAFKTSCVIAERIQHILSNPNTRGMVYMETGKNASKTVGAMADMLLRKEVEELWGDQKGTSKDWSKWSFTVGNRTEQHRIPTVQVGGSDVNTTGDHILWLRIDDPLSYQSARNAEIVDKVIDGWLNIQPLKDPGADECVSLTPYAKGDMADKLCGEHAQNYRITRIPCGCIAKRDAMNRVILEGRSRFPHLTEEYLLQKARTMGPERFNLNYGLTMDENEGQIFRREDLIAHPWEDRFSYLSAYILTDTAVSTSKDSCQSVLALVIMDWDDVAYVVDLRAGHWNDTELLEQFCAMHARWASRLRIVGVAMERVSLNTHIRSSWDREIRARGIPVRWIELRRSQPGTKDQQGQQKALRIRALENRVITHRLRFLPSVPKTCTLHGKLSVLYDPEGYHDPTGKMLPAGEIVEQFVRWNDAAGYRGMQDIPDCLAALDEVSHDGMTRMIPPSPRRSASMPEPTQPQDRVRRTARMDLLSRIRR